MHVAWTGVLDPHPGRPRPALAALRASVAARLRHVPRFRQRLAFPPLGVAEPCWVDDPYFDVAWHVIELDSAREPLSRARFHELADDLLSRPLDRSRPLWQIALAPELEGGQVGVVCRIHHALVDGKSAVELALLLLDAAPDSEPGLLDDWTPSAPPGAARMALDAMVDGAGESLRAAGGLMRLARSPRRGAGRIADTLRHTALAVEADLLRPAPASFVNPPIGPRRTLSGPERRPVRVWVRAGSGPLDGSAAYDRHMRPVAAMGTSRTERYRGSVMTLPSAPTRASAGLPEMSIVNWPRGRWLPPASTARALRSSPAATS